MWFDKELLLLFLARDRYRMGVCNPISTSTIFLIFVEGDYQINTSQPIGTKSGKLPEKITFSCAYVISPQQQANLMFTIFTISPQAILKLVSITW